MQNHESPYSTVCTNDLDVELQEPEEPSSSAAPTIASCSQLDIQANDASNAVDERSIHSKSALGGGDAELRMFSAPEALGIEMTSVHTSSITTLELDASKSSSNQIEHASHHSNSQPNLVEEHDLAQERASRTKSKRDRKGRPRLPNWRSGVAACTAISAIVLVANCAFASWAFTRSGSRGGVVETYVGDCDVVNTWALWLHILINGLSTILLSASNYTMQCLISPTRKECDAAHLRKSWLDIGVPGIRNLTRIHWRRVVLWIILAATSLPVHLLYNSAVFKTLASNKYLSVVVHNNFMDSDSGTTNPSPSLQMNATLGPETLRTMYNANSSSFDVWSPIECINNYAVDFLSDHSHVLVVSEQDGNDTTVVRTGDDSDYSWILSNYTEYKPGNTTGQYRPDNTTGLVQDIGLDRTKWTVAASTVKQCLSLKTREYCQLQFSMQFMIIVIVCNLFKCIAMLCTLFFERDTPLTTVGDALASWLDEPDDSTKGSCLITKDKPHTENIGVDAVNTSSITYYAPFTRRWHHATSTRRWGVTITLWTAALFVTTGFMGRAIATAGATGRTITSFGFGSVNSRTTIDIGTTFSTGKQLLGAVLLVNLPQALLSFLYMMSNGLITSMCAAHEYSKYSVARRSLRVTDPVGRQRSTYWLQLPFAYSIPLIITSGLLHWVVSQSIFLVKISYWMDRVESLHQAKSAVGYSCWPIICTISIGFTIVFTITAMGFRRLPGMIPIAGSCSLAIAAAAHRPEDDVEAASCLVKWGEVPQVSHGAVGHCCFTSKEVTDVRPGKKYA